MKNTFSQSVTGNANSHEVGLANAKPYKVITNSLKNPIPDGLKMTLDTELKLVVEEKSIYKAIKPYAKDLDGIASIVEKGGELTNEQLRIFSVFNIAVTMEIFAGFIKKGFDIPFGEGLKSFEGKDIFDGFSELSENLHELIHGEKPFLPDWDVFNGEELENGVFIINIKTPYIVFETCPYKVQFKFITEKNNPHVKVEMFTQSDNIFKPGEVYLTLGQGESWVKVVTR